MDLKSKIILIYGPTASGKSNFSVLLAKKIKGEIINADSMQIYKELKILTARPKMKEYKNIKHHLYGIRSVKKNFSTGEWLKLSIKKINEIKKRKKTPIIVGGTGLYFKALTEGLVKIPNIPSKFRNKVRLLQKEIGQKKFFEKLIKLDPSSKNTIKATDIQRSIRAYEVKLYSKKSLKDWFKNTRSKYSQDDFYKIYLDFPRFDLIKRISKRSEKMLNEGAILEVKNFLNLKINLNNSSNKIIGINIIKDYLQGKCELKDLKEKISIKTRQYAKRQNTWARGQMVNWHKLNPKDLNKFLKKI
tara:strand:- start:75 stop:983 length:909 start_codon:yes stop_codon:yes gene_type:complete